MVACRSCFTSWRALRILRRRLFRWQKIRSLSPRSQQFLAGRKLRLLPVDFFCAFVFSAGRNEIFAEFFRP